MFFVDSAWSLSSPSFSKTSFLISCPPRTCTFWVIVESFPVASVVVQVTVVIPTGNSEGASFVIVGLGSTMSFAVAVPKSIASPKSATISAGIWSNLGAIVSLTVTSKLRDAELSLESVLVHVTVVVVGVGGV